MFQVVSRWQVDVTLSDGQSHRIWISDNFAANVLRKVAEIEFAPNGLIQAVAITIGRQAEPKVEASWGGSPANG